MASVTSEQAAYMAGAIDGEGWIGLRRKSPDTSQWMKSPSYVLGLTIANTSRPWLETLQTWFGGHIEAMERRSERNRKDCFRLKFRASEVLVVLMRVRPYLLLKARQADLLMEFQPLAHRRRALNGLRGRPSSGADQDIVGRQEAIYQELRLLNQRGVVMQNYAPLKPREIRKCGFKGCDRKHYGHGYCWMHYRKFIVRGGPALRELSCRQCGKEFQARRSDAAYCSKECSGKAYYRVHADRIKQQVAGYKRRKQ